MAVEAVDAVEAVELVEISDGRDPLRAVGSDI